MKSTNHWLRTPRCLALLATAFVTSLVLGTGFLVTDDSGAGAVDVRGVALTDDEAAAQVVDSARQVVTAAQLRDVTGGYSFVSCTNENEPPYQAALYMNVRLPQRMAGLTPRRWLNTSARSSPRTV
jgi:hypothetical protein